jgi:hypothetical protein
VALVTFVALFDLGLRYKISAARSEQLDSDDFLYMLEAITDAKVNCRTGLHVLTNGDRFYEAELAAINGAAHPLFAITRRAASATASAVMPNC